MSTLIDIKEASKKLGITKQHVRNLCREGKLKAQKIGNSWVFESSTLDESIVNYSKLDICDHPISSSRKNESDKLVALSFFSGAMGLDIGIEKAGFDIRLACEVDKYCRQTIELNKPDIALLSDINDYNAQDIRDAAGLTEDEDIDLIVGGPPCQAFSTAGKRKAFNDDRGNVFLKYIDLSIELNPKYIVIENVRGLLSCPLDHRPHNQRGEKFPDLEEDELKGGALNFILKKLENSGYSYSFNLYNSANFGTPQVRERVIIICSRDQKEPPFLIPTHSGNEHDNLPEWKTFRQAVKGIEKHSHLNFPEKRLKYYRILKSGQNWRSLPEELQKEAMGKSYYSGGWKTGFLRRLDWDKPSPTLVTHPAMPATDLAHPSEDRPLSVEEYKKIQEFPDDWKISGPLIQQYKQIGNAVPTSLGKAVGTLIEKLIRKERIESVEGFKYSRYKRTAHYEWKEDFEKSKINKKELYRKRAA